MQHDAEFFKQQSSKMNAFKDLDELVEEPTAVKEDSRSMQDVLREKREAAERAIQQNAQGNGVESIEDRKKRLQAQRDLLVK